MGLKTAGVGHFTIPTAPAAGASCTSGAANVFTTTYVQLIASTVAASFITGIHVESAAALAATYIIVQLATGGAGSETIVGQYLVPLTTGSTVALGYRPIFPPIPVAISTRISCKTADSVGAKATLITLEAITQANVVSDGTIEDVNMKQILGTAVSTPATAGILDVNVKNMNNVAATAITTIKAVQGLAVDGVVTTVTNQLTAAAIATGIFQDTTAGDFTVAASVGKSIMNGVALGTGLTINGYTGNTVQTGDSYARLGAPAGASVSADVAAINTKTTNLPAAPASTTNITSATGVDITKLLGTAIATPSVAGLMEVNVKKVNNNPWPT